MTRAARAGALAWLLASGLWLLAAGPALAAGGCQAEFGLDQRACEETHHGPLIAMAGGIIAIGAAIAAAGSGLAGVTAGPIAPSPPAGTRDAGGPEPGPIRPEDLGLPDADAWGNRIYVNNGEYGDGAIGQIWWDGRWVDADAIRDRVRAGFDAVAARDAQRESFWREGQRISGDWLARRTAENEAEAAAERAANARRAAAWDQLDRIGDIALGHDYGDIFRRAQDGVFREDGTLDVELVERLAEATRNRIGRDVAAPDEVLSQGWVEDFVTTTARDAAHSTVIRIGSGVLSGGSSEIFFQGLKAAETMKAAVDRAVDAGQDYSTTDALRDGVKVLVEENLPVNTIRVLGDPKATWTDVAAAGAMDVFAATGTLETAHNLAGSLSAARSGAGLGEILTHRAPGLFDDLFRRSGEGDRLWRDPMDVDWQTGGPRAGLDLEGLHTRGATIDGNSAAGLAGPPPLELNPPGGVQTRLPEEWGLQRPAAIHMQQVAQDELVRVTVRPATTRAPELLDRGVAVPKPPEIKVKTVNGIDIEYLGRSPHTEGMAAHFDPPMPGSPPGMQPAGMEDDLWKQVWERYEQRKIEYTDNLKSVHDLDGWSADPDGVLRNARGQAATGDNDLWDITNFDGSPVSEEVRRRVVQRLMDGPAQVQHGAHVDWPAQARADYAAGLRDSPDLSPKEVDIYNRIVRSHQEGKEALIQFGAGQPRVDTTYTYLDEMEIP